MSSTAPLHHFERSAPVTPRFAEQASEDMELASGQAVSGVSLRNLGFQAMVALLGIALACM